MTRRGDDAGGMHMADVTRTFRVRPFGLDDRFRTLDHLSEGERDALARGNLSATLNKRAMRWN